VHAALRLLFLTLQLEIELLLALHYRKKVRGLVEIVVLGGWALTSLQMKAIPVVGKSATRRPVYR